MKHKKKINYRNQYKGKWVAGVCFILLSLTTACKKLYNLPDEKEYLNQDVSYSSKLIEPILGRTSLMRTFNSANSSLPLKFEIVNARYGDGRPVTDLFQVRPTLVWTAEYDGKETSLEEIESKRKVEERPLFEVRESGQFIMWASSNDDLIAPRPADSSNLVQERRYFDLKVSNSGGTVLIQDFQVIPWRERPYSPSTDINNYTGDIARDPTDLNNPFKRDYIRPNRLSNVIGRNTRNSLRSNDTQKDVVVFIRQFDEGTGKLRFKFEDTEGDPINPTLFNQTKWDQLVHGFNQRITNEYVEYDVAYPIPLVNIPTPYTNSSGSVARVNFNYARRGFGGSVVVAEIGLDFNIYRPGNWEIVFKFMNDNPKFEDE